MEWIISGLLVSTSFVVFDFSLVVYLFFRSNSTTSTSECSLATVAVYLVLAAPWALPLSAIGFGMKSLMLCFVFNSLFSGVAVVGVVLDLVFGLPFLLIDLHFVVVF